VKQKRKLKKAIMEEAHIEKEKIQRGKRLLAQDLLKSLMEAAN